MTTEANPQTLTQAITKGAGWGLFGGAVLGGGTWVIERVANPKTELAQQEAALILDFHQSQMAL